MNKKAERVTKIVSIIASVAIGVILLASCTKETVVKLNDCDCEMLQQEMGVYDIDWVTDTVIPMPSLNCDDETGNWLYVSPTKRKKVICFIK